MNKYLVNFNYSARYGEKALILNAGETVTLETDVAEWVNRDSEGCLTPVTETTEDETRQEIQPPADRQMKPACVRKDRQTHPGEGVMSTADFKAVKDKDQ